MRTLLLAAAFAFGAAGAASAQSQQPNVTLCPGGLIAINGVCPSASAPAPAPTPAPATTPPPAEAPPAPARTRASVEQETRCPAGQTARLVTQNGQRTTQCVPAGNR